MVMERVPGYQISSKEKISSKSRFFSRLQNGMIFVESVDHSGDSIHIF